MTQVPAHIIERKRDGHELSPAEIAALVSGFVRQEVSDAQMAAWAMAVYFRGMTPAETAALTREMLHSGNVLKWSPGGLPKVDKHSTGGVGDKVSLILAPLLACCGVQVPMISGRGLGATGGTLDKLEAIPGFRTNLSEREIVELTERVGCVITGQTDQLVPADKRLYALRDVTGTVPSVPLITASILSKKLAESLDALVLDVKCGSGAFMKTATEARALARSLVDTGTAAGLRVSALLTDMNQPLGRMIGNAVEVNEAVEVLRGEGPTDLTELTVALCAEVLQLAGVARPPHTAETQIRRMLASGHAFEKFCEMVRAQGGDPTAPRPVLPATHVFAARAGFITSMHCAALGQAVVRLGGGRRQIADRINPAVGLEMLVRIGDEVARGQPLARIFADQAGVEDVRDLVCQAVTIGDQPPTPPPLILDRLVP